MRIVFDLDGVICELKKPNESYGEVKPKLDVIKLVNELHSNGDHIIIHTGRHMRTCNGNVDEVIKKVGKITKDWLKKNNVKYDELIFGKPHADMYIDDLGLSFDSADKLKEKMNGIKLNFIIPMGGEGKRFKNSKFNKPKFMIETKNKTLLEWAIQSLPLDFAHKIFFIIRKNDEQNFRVKEFIKKIMKEKFSNIKFEILLLSKNTRGQAETVLSCKKEINNDRALLIFNNDTYFKSVRLKSRLLSMRNQKIDGILGIFNSNNPEYSFVKIDKDDKVIDAEKFIDVGDIGIGYATIIHGVAPVNIKKNPDWNDINDGRWFLSMYSNESDEVKNRHTAHAISDKIKIIDKSIFPPE